MTEPYEIEIYKTSTGKEPFNEWLENLDKNVYGRIDARLTRLSKQVISEFANLLGMVFLN